VTPRTPLWIAPLFALALAGCAALPFHLGAAGLWPARPNWQQYVEAPTTRNLHPVRVVRTSGAVVDPQALIHPGSGATTLTRTATATGPTDIVLDYGKDIGGIPQFTVTKVSGAPTLMAGYSETLALLTPTGDTGTPAGNGDPHRYDSYTVSAPGLITNRFVQGGERYEEISLTSPGSITLSSVEIYFEPFLGTPKTFQGYFVSSSPALNRLWYDGAYTVNLVQIRPGTPGGVWTVADGSLSAAGGNVGQLTSGAKWTDYTMSFRTEVAHNQAGWVVRSQGLRQNDLLILDASNDAHGPPNQLQQVVQEPSGDYVAATAPVPFSVTPGTWYTVQTTVAGTSITTSIDGRRVATLDTATLPAGVPVYGSGTVGFREYTDEEARFANLRVTSPQGGILFSSSLAQASDLSAFAVPGSITEPLILDGAKRDRMVWEGDLAVSAPTLFYSSDQTQYVQQSLRLLGSYQLQSGFVEADQSPAAPVNTAGLLPGTVHGYASATYSMDFVINLATYYLYTGDTAFVRQEWPIVQRELAWNASQLSSAGLFVTTGQDNRNWNLEYLSGTLTANNVLYYQALVDGAQLADAVGQTGLGRQYQLQATTLRQAINRTLWDPSLGAYDAGTAERGVVAQDANALALLFGVAPAADVQTILNTMRSRLLTPFGALRVSTPAPAGFNQDISPFIGSMQLWAMFAAGDTNGAMQLLTSEWGPMAASDPGGTFWERLSSNGTSAGTSYAHGWSTGPTSALSAYVLGVRPTAPGFSQWIVQPHPGSLSWAEGRAPTPHGAITVDWGYRAESGEFALHIAAPRGTTGAIGVPTYGRKIEIRLNGRVVWNGTAGLAYHAHAGGTYVELSGVPGGSDTLVATPV
jgi:alpha-L-rhamnosidase